MRKIILTTLLLVAATGAQAHINPVWTPDELDISHLEENMGGEIPSCSPVWYEPANTSAETIEEGVWEITGSWLDVFDLTQPEEPFGSILQIRWLKDLPSESGGEPLLRWADEEALYTLDRIEELICNGKFS